VSPSVDMLPFGVTIPVTVPQRSEIAEGLMNYPVYSIVVTLFDPLTSDTYTSHQRCATIIAVWRAFAPIWAGDQMFRFNI